MQRSKLSQNEILERISASLSREDIEAFKKDGAICIRNVLRPAELECLASGIELNLKCLSPRAKIASLAEDPGAFIEDFCTWQTNPHYQSFIFDSSLGAMAALLMESKISRLYHDHLLVKEPHTRQKTPWHQDQPYYNIDGRQNCSFWIPIDPIPYSSTLEFIAGSHLGPWLMPRSFMNNQAKWFPEGSLAELPDIEANRESFPIIGWEVNPGDIICFHMLTLHAAGGVANQRRRVFSLRFIGSDITHAPRAWMTSPEFPDLVKDIPAGKPMQGALFPVVWQRDL